MRPDPGFGLAFSSPVLPLGLSAALRRFAARPLVLLALDFDGVLAPIVTDPRAARPLPGSRQALEQLSALPDTRIALVSGRALAELRDLADPPSGTLLIAGHGAEADLGELSGQGADPEPPGEAETALLARVVSALERIVVRYPGTAVETKPASAVLHTRTAEPAVSRSAARAVDDGPGRWPGVEVTLGKEVVELAVTRATKGQALTRLRSLLDPATRVLYLGDDVTDESAFAVLDDAAGDLTIKVGAGPTVAVHRVLDPSAVSAVLTELSVLRRG